MVMSAMIRAGVIHGLCRMCRGKKPLQSAAVGALWNFSATHAKLVIMADNCGGLWKCALAGVVLALLPSRFCVEQDQKKTMLQLLLENKLF
jgi:hypothetical protein